MKFDAAYALKFGPRFVPLPIRVLFVRRSDFASASLYRTQQTSGEKYRPCDASENTIFRIKRQNCTILANQEIYPVFFIYFMDNFEGQIF